MNKSYFRIRSSVRTIMEMIYEGIKFVSIPLLHQRSFRDRSKTGVKDNSSVQGEK